MGSEMCIRDRCICLSLEVCSEALQLPDDLLALCVHFDVYVLYAVGRDSLIEAFVALVREVISLFLSASSTSDLVGLGVGVTSDDDDDSAA